jgi:carbamoyl-phosphate synthase small subunit
MVTAPEAVLVLEDGRSFAGRRFGAPGDALGEVVFNTSMSGYPEILTDPSYAGQIVVMTYPMIGNYGITAADFEARRAFLSGFVVKEVSRVASNWRNECTLPEYLAAEGIPGLFGIDTRALVRHLRERGAMRGIIAGGPSNPSSNPSATSKAGLAALVERARAHPSMVGCDLASGVTAAEPYPWTEPTYAGRDAHPVNVKAKGAPRHRVVAMDFGVKRNMLRMLVDAGCELTVVPAGTSAADVMALKPDGVLLSNGPGDPEPVTYAVETVRALLGRVPIFGICLGHQLLALAAGGRTYKLTFGHRGANHPVMDLATRKVEITSHNHGFAVDPESLPANVEVTHRDLNDGTVEGIRLRDVPAFGIQYHPEAAPGPHDAAYLFDRFVDLMGELKGEHRGAR